MAAAYTKELLVNVFLYRYRTCCDDKLVKMANDFFDEVGRDKFRVYCCVTPESIREYKRAN